MKLKDVHSRKQMSPLLGMNIGGGAEAKSCFTSLSDEESEALKVAIS